MDRSGIIKVIAAFVVGVVLALGGALAFVKVNEAREGHPATAQTVTQPVTAVQPPAAVSADQNAPEPEDTADAVPQSSPPEPRQVEPRKPKPAAAQRTAIKPSREALQIKPNPRPVRSLSPSEPIQIAQNSPGSSSPAPPQASYPPLSGQNQPQAPGTPVPGQPETPAEPALAAPTKPQPHVVELAAGTNVTVRLNEPLSTEHNYSGDTFRATLDAPIIRDGFVIAEKGSKVLGRVVSAQPAGRVKGVSQLNLTLSEINTTDGQRIPIETNTFEKQGPTTTGTDTAKIAGGAALGALIGALGGGGKGAAIGAGAGGAAGTGVVLATRGKPTNIASESRLGFALTKPVTITEKFNN